MQVVRGLVGFVVIGLIGYLIPVIVIDHGLGSFSGDELEVARTALSASRHFADHPLERLAFIRARVVHVEYVPDHCPGHADADALSDYTAQVRYYTLFALPIEMIYATCGGDAVSRTPPALP